MPKKQQRQIVFVKRLVPKWILLESFSNGSQRCLTRYGKWKAGGEEQATKDDLFDSKRASKQVFKKSQYRT